ncbi:hypothetical protein CHCC5024_3616 [Bacillus licheniformis]|nr:hypothetical protein MUY_003421 [Bacillus licheniformis WX-02]OLG03779.1 hypothetical protein B4124_1699 [Bacillus licheniformis]TWJ48745.1 hypothetical protein CHCC5024_3616 [Bacillus licheniformis]TWK60317.1 hypothetical protein CHCC20343_3239 [Bacillus licheniformis]TWL54494.1 hypothetical protein CHCC15335_2684 [Bacillus licheniformis]
MFIIQCFLLPAKDKKTETPAYIYITINVFKRKERPIAMVLFLV